MKLAQNVMKLFLATFTASALAQGISANGNSVTGRVETVFVRESRNLFIEKKLLRPAAQKELWAEVRIASPARHEYVNELARLPENLLVERGDLVETLIADSTLSGASQFASPGLYAFSGGVAPLPEVNRVTMLVAKRDTLRAMLFGLYNPPPSRGLYTEAQACTGPGSTALAYFTAEPVPAIAR
jgi:hypothetical protein